jgi:hypothetical protein
MAKVKLEGAVKLEFEVRYGLNEDLVIKVHSIDVGKGRKVLIGEGDISHINERTLEFIANRIESLLRKNKALIGLGVGFMGVSGFYRYGLGKVDEEERSELHKAMYQTELGKLIMDAYVWRKEEAIEEVVQRKLFPISLGGMFEFIEWKIAKEKAKEWGYGLKEAKHVVALGWVDITDYLVAQKKKREIEKKGGVGDEQSN